MNRAALAALVAPVALLLGAGACGPHPAQPTAEAGSPGATIVRLDGDLWVTSPDDDTLVHLTTDGPVEIARLDVVAGPEQISVVRGVAVVTGWLDEEVAIVSLDTRAVQRLRVPCGGTWGVATWWEGTRRAAISCPLDGRLVQIDIDAPAVTEVTSGLTRPTAVVWHDGRLSVSSSSGGVVYTAGSRVTVDTGDRGASQLDTLVATDAGLIGVYQLVDHDGDRDRPPSEGGYGSVVDDAPRIQPALHGPCGPTYARFDGGRLVLAGPVAAAAGPSGLWIVHQYTKNVAVLDCDQGVVSAVLPVGAGARGIALDGDHAWVDVGFDHAITRISQDPAAPPVTLRREVVPVRLSAQALTGRKLFHDATNTHLTPSGVVTCATCHPRGGDDGLRWFLHTPEVSRRLRKTDAAWNARALAPLHWDGEFSDGASLARHTIRELMNGDGLLVDVDAMGAWLTEVPVPPGRSAVNDDDEADIARGATVFQDAGCVVCHAGQRQTDGLSHTVTGPSDDPDGDMATTFTRPLSRVGGRGPFLHDGRAPTLRSIHAEHNPNDLHGATSQLDEADRAALVRYLETR